MRFGVHLPRFGSVGTTENIRRIAEVAETVEFDSIWVSDHVVSPTMMLGYFGASFWEPLRARGRPRNARSCGHE